MIKNIEINDVAKETLTLLRCFDKDCISKIPIKFLNCLENLAQQSSINVLVDKNKKLKEQNVSYECKNLISLIYHDFLADANEKEKMEHIWNENEKIYREFLEEKYNPNNLFVKTNYQDSTIEKKEDNVSMVKYNTSLVRRMWNKILKILKKC